MSTGTVGLMQSIAWTHAQNVGLMSGIADASSAPSLRSAWFTFCGSSPRRWCACWLPSLHLTDEDAAIQPAWLERPPVSVRPRHTALGRAKGWSGPDLLSGRHKVSFTGPGPDYKDVVAVQIDARRQLVLHKTTRVSCLLGRPAPFEISFTYALVPGDEATCKDRLAELGLKPFEAS
jgi:hypothetical protein